jgi:serine/threonine protein kinase
VLKRILRERAADAQFARMFLDEARLAAQLQHPNIAAVYDIGMLGDSYFFTMEYVHGETLRSLVRRAQGLRRPVPLACALTIIAGAAAGLHHAHERNAPDGRPLGIVHRDVSPSNLMVSYEGNVKVVDFGVAKAANRAVETNSGTVKGKISYLSPEQCRGAHVDRRSDLFSLGIVMWEMLTGARLYRRDTDFASMTAIVHEVPSRPSLRRAEVPRAVDDIVLRLLAKSVADRFQTAAEVVEAIENASMRAGTILSPSAVSRLVRDLFGVRAEPWLEFERDTLAHEMLSFTSQPIPFEAAVTPSEALERGLARILDLSDSSGLVELTDEREPPPAAPPPAAPPPVNSFGPATLPVTLVERFIPAPPPAPSAIPAVAPSHGSAPNVAPGTSSSLASLPAATTLRASAPIAVPSAIAIPIAMPAMRSSPVPSLAPGADTLTAAPSTTSALAALAADAGPAAANPWGSTLLGVAAPAQPPAAAQGRTGAVPTPAESIGSSRHPSAPAARPGDPTALDLAGWCARLDPDGPTRAIRASPGPPSSSWPSRPPSAQLLRCCRCAPTTRSHRARPPRRHRMPRRARTPPSHRLPLRARTPSSHRLPLRARTPPSHRLRHRPRRPSSHRLRHRPRRPSSHRLRRRGRTRPGQRIPGRARTRPGQRIHRRARAPRSRRSPRPALGRARAMRRRSHRAVQPARRRRTRRRC